MAAVNYKNIRKHYRVDKNNMVEKFHFIVCDSSKADIRGVQKIFGKAGHPRSSIFWVKAESVTPFVPSVNILVFVCEVIFYSLTKNIMSLV